MGRKKLYHTIEQKRAANLKARKKYYVKNAEKIRKTRMDKYYADLQSKEQKEQ